MKTIQSLNSFLSSLNITCESIDDKEAFYDFCISSCIEKDRIMEDEFNKIFRNSNKQCPDENIQKYFSRYGEYMDLLEYAVRNWFLKVDQEN